MKQNNIKDKIKSFFLTNPTAKLRVREIERTLSLSLPSVIRYTKELTKQNILRTQIIGKVTLYTASLTSPKYKIEKLLHNLKILHQCGLIEHLKEYYSNPPLILFGSYARAEDLEQSDVDIYVQTRLSTEPNLSKFEKRLNRLIQLHLYPNIQKPNHHLANNIINGIPLNSYVEVFNE